MNDDLRLQKNVITIGWKIVTTIGPQLVNLGYLIQDR